MDLRNRRRLQAVVIVGIFAASMIGAAAMMMSGWSPPTRSYGTPILRQAYNSSGRQTAKRAGFAAGPLCI